MAAAYQAGGVDREATFELFVRTLPAERRFLVAAGLDDALAGLEALALRRRPTSPTSPALGLFPPAFLDRLADLRFTGDVWAVPEGEVVFAGEPLLRVTAPLVEAQLVETWLLNRIASQTMVASKAARVALACGDRAVRRLLGPAGPRRRRRAGRGPGRVDRRGGRARRSWPPGRRFGIPLSAARWRTRYVMSLRRRARRLPCLRPARSPSAVVLLIDTYDTVEGARRAAEVAHELAGEGIAIAGGAPRLRRPGRRWRCEVRAVLDEAGLPDVAHPRLRRPRRAPHRRAAGRRARRSTPSASAPSSAPAPTPRPSASSTSWSRTRTARR